MTATATTAPAARARLRRDKVTNRRRVWVQNVAVQAEVLEARLEALKARRALTDEQQQVAAGVIKMVDRARAAAMRDNPIPSRWSMWWRGTLIEAAYQNLHAAEALLSTLFDPHEVAAEIPEAVSRVTASLHRDDPRRSGCQQLLAWKAGQDKPDVTAVREQLRKMIEVGHAASDQQHARLRSFRNLVLSAGVGLTVFMVAFLVVVSHHPKWLPLCFDRGGKAMVCPTGPGSPGPHDVLIVALVGVLGGVLAATLSVSKLQGNATPYNVPTALAVLKVPFGAMTAVGAILVIRGGFVPGLTNLDSQVQILGYAFLFGYAQEVLTRVIDKQGKSILDAVPSKDSSGSRPELGAT